jgi:hypothetical protein
MVIKVEPAVAAANPRLGQQIAAHVNLGLRGGAKLWKSGTPIGVTSSGLQVFAK